MKTTQLLSALFLLIVSFASAQLDDQFYQPSKEMKPFEMKISETISLPVDQDTITAYIAKPAKKFTKTILFFHGAGGNVTKYQYITKPLVDDGFQVIMVDMRGYGKSTGTPTHINVAADGQKFFDAVMARPDVKNTKVYLFGSSLGSQVATHLARENKSKISGFIIDGGMSSFADIAIKFAPQVKDYINKVLGNIYSAKEDIKFTEGLPKLFIYSRKDSTIPFEQGELLFKNAPDPKKFVEFNAEHIQGLKDEPTEILKAINAL